MQKIITTKHLKIYPKEKAFDLFVKLRKIEVGLITNYRNLYHSKMKQIALIAVDELIKDNAINEKIVNGGLNLNYWQEVKKEIEAL